MDESTYGKFLPFLMQALGKATPWGSIGTIGLGAVQTIGSLIGLNKLKREPRPQYTISPELQKAYGMAESRATQGFMPTEIAQFQQGLAGTLESQRRNAIAMGGGGLSQAITGALGGQALRSQNTFAAQDAERRLANERYFGSMAGQMQAQRNRITQQDVAYRMAKEQAMGQALRAGTTNLASGLNAFGYGLSKTPSSKDDTTSTSSTAMNVGKNTYEYPSWAMSQTTSQPKMPTGWFAPMSPNFNPNVSYPPIGNGLGSSNPFTNQFIMPQ